MRFSTRSAAPRPNALPVKYKVQIKDGRTILQDGVEVGRISGEYVYTPFNGNHFFFFARFKNGRSGKTQLIKDVLSRLTVAEYADKRGEGPNKGEAVYEGQNRSPMDIQADVLGYASFSDFINAKGKVC